MNIKYRFKFFFALLCVISVFIYSFLNESVKEEGISRSIAYSKISTLWNKKSKIIGSSDKNETNTYKACTMNTCFNKSRCMNNKFSFYIYDDKYNSNLPKSNIFSNILNFLKMSKYLTKNPQDACLFVLSVDTLDRDRRSPNFIKNIDELINNLTYWNHGQNHLIFNMYSGSWPNYAENLEFNALKAIIIKASFSKKNYRKNFDISFPLFHSDLPSYQNNLTINYDSAMKIILHMPPKKHFLTFKGKRYLNGVGTFTRNALYHFNNQRDVILLTTCKHGINWEEFKDDRCDIDNELYDKYDYNDLLNNSVFCLIPRGRRLGTYRFLESLKAGYYHNYVKKETV
jgi:glucuronyl/N-acetylglucosaminyl transferase EXT1